MFLLNILFTLIFIYLAFYIIYYFVFSIAGNLYKPNSIQIDYDNTGNFIVIIPAYKEDGIIVQTAQRVLQHNYPAEHMDITVIADSLQPETLEELRKLPVKTVEVTFQKSNKAAAINVALNAIDRTYDYVMVLDADNIMEKNCLYIKNSIFKKGAVAIQGRRKAKNQNNSIAVIDSISEEVNNHIFRKGQRALGFSSALIGSGMSFEYSYFKKLMRGIDNIWEDKELEFRILRDKNIIQYSEDAIIYDEKVSTNKLFRNQRTKWIAGQIYSLKGSFRNWRSLTKSNKDLLNKVVQTIGPPRSVILGLLPILFLLSLFVSLMINSIWWGSLLVLYLITLVLAIPTEMINKKLFKAFLYLPVAIAMIFEGIFRSFSNQNINFNTPHVHNTAES